MSGYQFQKPSTALPSTAKPTDAQGPANVCKGSPDGPSQGPAAADPQRVYPLAEYERLWLDRLVHRLSEWRNDDHYDTITLSRNEVIMLLEGLKRGHVR